jgi:hypothetical protein
MKFKMMAPSTKNLMLSVVTVVIVSFIVGSVSYYILLQQSKKQAIENAVRK